MDAPEPADDRDRNDLLGAAVDAWDGAAEPSWLTPLPEAERRIVGDDLREAAIDGPDAVEQVRQDWAATARIWADPALLAALTTPISEPLGWEVA